MATALNTKIVLKNTTKMSLNERFTGYRAQAQTANTYRQKIQMQRQASSANLRLAQQMANRPTVIAALRLKKRSLQNRLGQKQQFANGGNVKSRLNLGNKQQLNARPLQSRLGPVRRGRGSIRRGGFKSGTSPLLKGRLGIPKTGFNNSPQNPQRGGFRNRRGGFRGNRQGRGGNRNRQQVQTGQRRAPKIKANRGGGRGRGRGWWNAKAPGNIPSRQELDNQLDAYMAETKSNLDAQIGHYMSQG